MLKLVGFQKLIAARSEVKQAFQHPNWSAGHDRLYDSLPSSLIPSVKRGNLRDRVLAEIDQDGFIFSTDPLDVEFFNRREQKLPRKRSIVSIILRDGNVHLRKKYSRKSPDRGLKDKFWRILGLPFYTEVAAMLRLNSLPVVPNLRHIDLVSRTIETDYIWGENLRSQIAKHGLTIYDTDVTTNPILCRLSDADRVQRENSFWACISDLSFKEALTQAVIMMNQRGVAPMDVNLGNIIIGYQTGTLYFIDFELAQLESFPNWDYHLKEHRRLLASSFNLYFG